jgi:hypothetical protein
LPEHEVPRLSHFVRTKWAPFFSRFAGEDVLETRGR